MSGVARHRFPRWVPGGFLGRLSPQTREQLLSRGAWRSFESGHRLLSEGAEDTHIALLGRGFVKVTTVVEGLEALLAIRVPGDIVGETAALTGRPRMATVTACGPITAMVLAPAAFEYFLDHHPDAARHVAAIMSERLRWANQRRTDFVAYPAEVRLARVLTQIATMCGQRSDEGILLGVALSQPELASMIGVAEVTLHKAMRGLRRNGLIRSGYRRITILDIEALSRVGEGVSG